KPTTKLVSAGSTRASPGRGPTAARAGFSTTAPKASASPAATINKDDSTNSRLRVMRASNPVYASLFQYVLTDGKDQDSKRQAGQADAEKDRKRGPGRQHLAEEGPDPLHRGPMADQGLQMGGQRQARHVAGQQREQLPDQQQEQAQHHRPAEQHAQQREQR